MKLVVVAGVGAAAAAYLIYLKSRPVKLTLGYWTIRGLAAPARMMAVYAGVDLQDVQYDLKPKEGGGFDPSAWFGVKPALQQENAYMNLPYVRDNATGLIIAQSTAVFQYIGRVCGLMGSGTAQLAAVEQTLAQAFDLRNDLMKFVYPFGEAKTHEDYLEHLGKHMKGSCTDNYKKFEGFLGDKPFTAGSSVTAGDFHVWEMLDQHEMMAKKAGLPSPLANYPRLTAFYARFRALPKLATYFASDAYALPCNNKMAHFLK